MDGMGMGMRRGGVHGRGAGRGEQDPGAGAPRPQIRRLVVRFWPFLRPHRWAIAFGTSCVILALLLQKVQPLISRYLVDQVFTPVLRDGWSAGAASRALRLLALGVGTMIVLSALSTLVSRLRMFVMGRAGARLVVSLRLRLYEHLQRLPLGYYETRQTGEIMSRVTGDVTSMEHLVTGVSDHILTDVLNLVVSLAILFVLSWRLALVALVPVPLLVFLMWRFSRRVRPVYRAIRDRLGQVNAKLQDNLSGIRVIKAFHTEDAEAESFRSENAGFYDAQLTGIRLWSGTFPVLGFVQGMGAILVTAAGGYMLLQPSPRITLGDLFAFNAYVLQLYAPIGGLFRMYDVLLRSLTAGERILEVLDAEPEPVDKPDARAVEHVAGCVRFENVSFRYATGENVLENVTLQAKPGEVIALVGRSGAGKTSLANLIPRFYDPAVGRVLLDGIDLRDVTRDSLRRQIAIVLQDAFLFNGTVAENIRYGRADASVEEIVHAAEVAQAREFIDRLPQGYDTQIGERGVRLSGGQKQRVAIARALLADRRILVLDEATSMVDAEAEYLIQKALAALMKGRTTFVIAHRLSTIKNADQIVVIHEGRVAEQGRHEELLSHGGVYAQLVQAQSRLAMEDDLRATPGRFPGAVVQAPDLSMQ